MNHFKNRKAKVTIEFDDGIEICIECCEFQSIQTEHGHTDTVYYQSLGERSSRNRPQTPARLDLSLILLGDVKITDPNDLPNSFDLNFIRIEE